MRLGVIRADLPGPVLLSALETVSQYNPSTEPRGQEVYISRPTVAEVEAVLANATTGAGAVLNGGNISGSFPLVINGTNDDLRLKTSAAAAFTVVLIPQASYTNLNGLIAALNTVLPALGITARENVAGNGVALESNTKGVSSYIQNDTVANGSVGNTPLALTNGSTRTMPAASAFITAMLPVGGPLNVATATINGVGATTNANALSLIPASRGTQEALADAVAPQLIETATVIDSLLVGQIAALLSADFNPDPRRKPALTDGPAIEVVQDDGVTPFAATLPTITSATLNSPSAGDITIAGTGLGDAERLETVVKVAGAVNKVLQQKIITTNGGSVSDTAIVLKAVLIPGATTVTTNVRVQVRQRVSDIEAVA